MSATVEIKSERTGCCRICQSYQDENMFDMLQGFKEIEGNEDKLQSICESFTRTIGIKISADDELSRFVCGGCFSRFQDLFLLRRQAEEAHRKIAETKNLQNNNVENNSGQIIKWEKETQPHCLICMGYDDEMSDIFSDITFELDVDYVEKLSNIFEEIVGISPSDYERGDKLICGGCVSRVIGCSMLRYQALKANANPVEDTFEIKQEHLVHSNEQSHILKNSNSSGEMSTKRSSNLDINVNKKRSRKAVTLDIKLEILRRIEAGQKITEISNALGLAKSTVQTIRDKKEKIKKFSQSAALSCVSNLTRERNSIIERMEKLLGLWIEDNTRRNMPIDQTTVQEKAKSIFQSLTSEDICETIKDLSFIASRGWFQKFKKRHNLHNITTKGGIVCVDVEAANEYPDILKKIIERGGYCPEQVFNVAETGLYWKRMPERTYIARDENCAPGYKVSKERLTLLLGANASGDFKLKPLLVYFSENPRALKGLDKRRLPVIWKSNKKCWMDKLLFEDWFKHNFCPEVKSYLQNKNLANKILLLLHHGLELSVNLSELPEDVEIQFLPKNTTALIQPMDQGTIATFKGYYLRTTFQQLINENGSGSSIKQSWKNFNIKHAVENISKSWKELKSATINQAWEKIWPECVIHNDVKIDLDLVPEIRQSILILGKELGFDDMKEDDVIDLLNADRKPLSNEELIQLEIAQEPNNEVKLPMRGQLDFKDLSKAFKYFQKGIDILLQADPDEERSGNVSRSINSSLNCYRQLQKEATQDNRKE